VSNQYSLTEYYHPVKRHEVELPSVIFLYDFSPITVNIAVKRRSLLHLLVRFCAVVGGVFAVTGLLDSWVHRAVTFATATTNGRR
jgi:endoplasmic reticulum-Golgi intermediate compartment protein 3